MQSTDSAAKSPDAECLSMEEEEKAASASWKALFVFSSRAQTLLLIFAVTLAIISGICVPVLAFLLGRIFNDFSSYGNGQIDSFQLTSQVNSNIFYLLFLGGASWIFSGAFFSIWMLFGELQAKNARTRLYEAMMAREVAWYETRSSGAGAMVSRLQTQIRDLQIATSQPFGFVIHHLATVVAALGLAFWNTWDLTLVTLASVPVGVVVLAFLSGRMQPAIDQQTERLTAATNLIKSVVDAIDIVKCFNAQDSEAWKYADIIRESAIHYVTMARLTSLQMGFVRLLTRTLFVQGFWYGSHLVMSGSRSSGQILTAFWGCLMATQTFEQILPQMMVLEKGRTAGRALQEFLESGITSSGSSAEPIGIQPTRCVGDVHLKDVSFAYPSQPSRQTLKEVSLFFPASETTFVVGRSGSGKSTFAALLTRLYNDWEGDIFIDTKRIERLDPIWLRQNVTIVQQDSVLFNETILRNIGFGRGVGPTIKRSSLDTAIETAALSTTLANLPDGLSTLVGAGGTTLSGGQTQRVALARARLRDTPILILDEATSALDRATAVSVMDAILSWRVGKTTIIITHELSQIGDDHFIYVFDQGQVVQEGFRYALEEDKNSPFVKLLLSTGAELRSPSTPRLMTRHTRNGSDYYRSRHLRSESQASTLAAFPTAAEFGTSPLKAPPSAYTSPNRRLERAASVISALSGSTMNVTGVANRRHSTIRTSPNLRRHSSRVSHGRGPSALRSTPTVISSPRASTAIGIRQYQKAREIWIERKKDMDVELEQISTPTQTLNSLRAQRGGSRTPTQTSMPLWSILRTVWPRLSMSKRLLLVLAFLLAAVHAACTPVFSFIFSQLLATFYASGDRSQAASKWSVVLFGLAAVDALAAFLFHYLLEMCAEAWINDIRLEALRRILNQPKSWFESPEADITQMVAHLDRGAEEMKNLLGRFAGLLFVAFMMTVIGLVWCLVVSWKLTLVGVSTAPLVYALTSTFDRVGTKWEASSNRASEVAAGIFEETFEKIKTIRSLTLEPHFRDKHRKSVAAVQQIGNRRSLISGIFYGLSDSSITFVTALIFWYGGNLVAAGTFSVTAITTVFTMLLFVITNVNAIVSFMPQLSSSRETATSLLKLTTLSSLDNHEHLGDTRLRGLPGPIRFRNVKFSYPTRPGVLALDKLNLDIQLETFTALVGLSGSGKSTIISLLLRLYSLRSTTTEGEFSGSLKVGDIPLSQLEISNWRSLVAYVPQQSKLFPGTIEENITFGLASSSPHSTTTTAYEAAAAAGIATFISTLPDGYETKIGEGGVGLSGGQKQKIAIARALIRRPRLLILDEPTSALDATSANEIRELLGRLVSTAGVTVLVVTHSIEMMKMADRVVVLEDGKLAQEGTFRDLRIKGPLRRVLGNEDKV